MKAQTRFAFVGLLVLIALITSIALPMTAFADEAPTPPPSSDSSGAAQPAQGADTSAPAQPADTAAPTDPPSATDAAAQATDSLAATGDPATAVASDTPAPTDTTKDTNSPAATDTPVVVLNSDGTVEPLATQEAANIIATGDPIWCPGNSTPGSAGCTSSHNTFNGDTGVGGSDPGLLSELGSVSGAGTIYIEYNYDSTIENGTSVTLDGSSLTTISNYALTIQGGWGAVPGSISMFTIPLSITNWTADVTINDLLMAGTSSLTVTNISGNTTGDKTRGHISVNGVTSNGTSGNGATLDNTSGSGNIDVSDSDFNGNLTHGLEAHSNGNVTLTDVIAEGNAYDGARLGGYLGDEVKGNILITGGDFSNNDWLGLEVYADGSITLDNYVTVNGNNNGTNYGNAYLSNVTPFSKFLNISISDSTFNGSRGDGLRVYSYGTVTLNNVIADGNSYDGAILGDPNSGFPIGGAINVHGGDFSNNLGGGGSWNSAGLEAYAAGNITLDNYVTANGNNNGSGAYLDNTYSPSIPGNISVSNSTFGDSSGTNGNGWDGLDAYSRGDITLTSVTADYNNDDGAYLNNTSSTDGNSIRVTSSDFSNNNNYDEGNWGGLEAYSLGSITLSSVTADSNGTDGASLDNCIYMFFGCSGNGDINISNSVFGDSTGTTGNGWDGLDALSSGDILLTRVTADSNGLTDGGDGVFLDNCLNWAGGGCVVTDHIISVDNSTGGEFNGNGTNGFEAYSGGVITLTDVTADSNAISGAVLGWMKNTSPIVVFPTEGDVYVHGGNFNNNGYFYGLLAMTDGYITLDNSVIANGNGFGGEYDGAYLDNRSGSSDINVSDSIFNGNGWYGFDAMSNGDITITNVTADGNTNARGAFLYSNGGDINVINSIFDGNSDGLEISLVASSVTLTCSDFSNNDGYGVIDNSFGPLTLNGDTFSDNGTGDYAYSGTPVIGIDCSGTPASSGSGGSSGGGSHNASGNIIPITGLPIHTIDVTGGEGNGLDCTQYGGTQLILPNNDSALFPCPISDSASLKASSSDKLPGTLPGGDTFVSGFTTGVIKNGASRSPVESPINVSFTVPGNMKNSNLAILYWDGSKWVEVSGHMTPDGHFETTTDLTGTFVLVSK